ncbi:hypothetical protein ACQ4PT_041126 [Festuca glaucescens]
MASPKVAMDAGLEDGAASELGAAAAVVADANQEVVAPVADLEDAALAEKKRLYAEIDALYEESEYYELCEDLTDMDYAPDTVDDTVFYGIALDCPKHVMNCGFNSWLDPEWPETLKNALATLWEKYHRINSLRIDERIENANLVKEITDEKIKIEKKYPSLVGDVNKFMDDTEIKIQKDNYANIMGNAEDQKGEVEALKDEVANLKEAQKTQAMMMRNCEVKWGDEREFLKKENKKLKKKLENKVQYLIDAGQDNKDNLMRIKAICDE